MRRNVDILCTHKDHGRTQWEGGHLQAEEGGLRRNQTWRNLVLGLVAFRIMRNIFLMFKPFSLVFRYSSPSKWMQHNSLFQQWTVSATGTHCHYLPKATACTSDKYQTGHWVHSHAGALSKMPYVCYFSRYCLCFLRFFSVRLPTKRIDESV